MVDFAHPTFIMQEVRKLLEVAPWKTPLSTWDDQPALRDKKGFLVHSTLMRKVVTSNLDTLITAPMMTEAYERFGGKSIQTTVGGKPVYGWRLPKIALDVTPTDMEQPPKTLIDRVTELENRLDEIQEQLHRAGRALVDEDD